MSFGETRIYVGLDLGQERNYTAMAVLERKWYQGTVAEFIASGGRGYQGEYRYRVVGLDRCSLGTPYTTVVEWVKRLLAPYSANNIGVLVVDATGCGSPVMDMLRRADIGMRLIGTVITGNQAAPVGGSGKSSAGYHTVPRTEILTALQMAVQAKRFTVSKTECREWQALSRELVLLRMQGKRAGVQDDLAFAVGLAVWWGMRPLVG
jgi:hypothetical protein